MDGGPGSNSSANSAVRSGLILAGSTGKIRMRKPSKTSLDVMAEEINNQIEDLPRFARELHHSRPYRDLEPSRMIFTGSGDSFASALFAQAISKGAATAADPNELHLAPNRVQGKTLFLISVSGKTKTNVRLARRVRGLAKKRVAITANPSSPLARECDDIILLHYRGGKIPTSGTVSFTASLLAVSALLNELTTKIDLRNVDRRATRWAGTMARTEDRRFLFVGSNAGYAIAAYGAFKIHEVLGFKAGHQYSEQFGHSQIFSVNKRSDIIVCIRSDRDEITEKVFRILSENGFQARQVQLVSKDPVIAALGSSLHMQHLAWSLARREGYRECAFLSDPARLNMSNRLIY